MLSALAVKKCNMHKHLYFNHQHQIFFRSCSLSRKVSSQHETEHDTYIYIYKMAACMKEKTVLGELKWRIAGGFQWRAGLTPYLAALAGTDSVVVAWGLVLTNKTRFVSARRRRRGGGAGEQVIWAGAGALTSHCCKQTTENEKYLYVLTLFVSYLSKENLSKRDLLCSACSTVISVGRTVQSGAKYRNTYYTLQIIM